jgi:tetratricopeptide (TPR) repeat protein
MNDDKNLLSTAQEAVNVIGTLSNAGGREFALFLGAGCSVTSGIMAAEGMIRQWKPQFCRSRRVSEAEMEEWLARQSNAYSALFEALFDDQRQRQQFLQPLIEAGNPGWGYLYLATMIAQKDRFNVIFTTNFDDLVNDALTEFANYNPVVCAADSQVRSISVMTDRAKVIKLHGDYLFEQLKNTEKELSRLDPNMEEKFRQFASVCGLVVLGYSGCDRSIMDVLGALLAEEGSFPRGVWWGVRRADAALSGQVAELARKHPGRFHLFLVDGFDEFMADLHAAVDCDLPAQISDPFAAHRVSMQKLLEKAPKGDGNLPAHAYILRHSAVLEKALGSPMAKASGVDELALLQAQLALGRRDHGNAVKFAEDYLRSHPASADALTTLGDALELQAEMLSEPKLKARAEKCWVEAIEADAGYLAPRQRLIRFYRFSHRFPEAIEQAEIVAVAAPADRMTRYNLAHLYMACGRLKEAQTALDALLAGSPDDAELHEMRAGVLQQRGWIPEAIDAYRKAVALMPGNARLHFQYANALAMVGEFDAAGNEFQQAIHLEPGNLAFRFQIATFYWGMQKPILALPHVEEAARLEPDSREALGWLGQIHMGLGDPAKAWAATEKALAITPDDTRLLINAGMILANLNRFPEAEMHLRKACAKNPALPAPYMQLCHLLRMQGRMQECNQELFKLQQVNPQAAQMLQMQLMQAQPQNAWGQAAQWLTGQQPNSGGPAGGQGKPQDIWSRLFG